MSKESIVCKKMNKAYCMVNLLQCMLVDMISNGYEVENFTEINRLCLNISIGVKELEEAYKLFIEEAKHETNT